MTTPEGGRYRRNRRHIIKRRGKFTYPDEGYTSEAIVPDDTTDNSSAEN